MSPILPKLSADVTSVERMSSPRMAKAELPNVRKADLDTWRTDVGKAIQRAISLRGWNLQQFAVAVDRDERQCARWIDGTDRPQLDAIFSVESMRQPLVVALAELGGAGVEIETVVRVKRTA